MDRTVGRGPRSGECGKSPLDEAIMSFEQRRVVRRRPPADGRRLPPPHPHLVCSGVRGGHTRKLCAMAIQSISVWQNRFHFFSPYRTLLIVYYDQINNSLDSYCRRITGGRAQRNPQPFFLRDLQHSMLMCTTIEPRPATFRGSRPSKVRACRGVKEELIEAMNKGKHSGELGSDGGGGSPLGHRTQWMLFFFFLISGLCELMFYSKCKEMRKASAMCRLTEIPCRLTRFKSTTGVALRKQSFLAPASNLLLLSILHLMLPDSCRWHFRWFVTRSKVRIGTRYLKVNLWWKQKKFPKTHHSQT